MISLIRKFSARQKEIFKFVKSDDYALICDGSVRSGKTTVMSMAFLLWAMSNFDRANFAICGKTVQSAERNVLKPLLEQEGLHAVFSTSYKVSTRVLTVMCGNRVNWFYLFGGKDESSYMLIQGITLAGVFFDEVALMPKSFVDQALARAISTEHPKYFFNCNPESPNHWFYKEWIEQQREKTTHIHFLLDDNPILTPAMIERTKSMYTGVFYDRYIRGLWVIADGLVYPMYDNTVPTEEREYERYFISMDYGTLNPTAMILWGMCNGVWYAVREYYHSGRETNAQKTDAQYYEYLEHLADYAIIRCVGNETRGADAVSNVIIDPSAASFIALVQQKRKFKVWKAKNDVVDGIRNTAKCINDKKILFNDCCKRTVQEFGLYAWDDKSPEDKPIKENDHAMDAVRYFVQTVRIYEQNGRKVPWLM